MRYQYVLPRPADTGAYPTRHLDAITVDAHGHATVEYTEPLDRPTVDAYELEEMPLHAWRQGRASHPEQVTPATIPSLAIVAKRVMLCTAPYHWREPGRTVTVDRIPVPAADARRVIQALPAWSRWAVEWLIDGTLHTRDVRDLTPHEVARLTARMRREGTAAPWDL